MPQDGSQKMTEQQERSDAFLVSVMPEAFRGPEGLTRRVVGEAEAKPAPAAPVPVPPPEPVPKVITPAQAHKATLEQPAVRPKLVSKKLFVIGGVFLALLLVGAVVVLVTLRAPKETLVQPEANVPEPTDTSTQPVTEPVVATPVEPTAETPVEPFADVLPGLDTDSDGLTDVEEQLFGTLPTRPDTDQDGYLDGNEVFHLYHPNGPTPQTLLDTGGVSLFDREGFPYVVYVLKGWQQTASVETQTLVLSAPTGESFQISEQSVNTSEDVQAWVQRTAQTTETLDPLRTKQGFVGAWSPDHLTAYIRFSPTQMLVLSYHLGRARRIEYRQSFEMFMNSLAPVEPVSPTP